MLQALTAYYTNPLKNEQRQIYIMYLNIKAALEEELNQLKAAGLFKEERVITSAQGAEISTTTSKEVLNFCANNYLGLS